MPNIRKPKKAPAKSEEKHARELGVKGVPCFIVNKELVLFGAQDKKIFTDIFSKIVNVR